MNLRRINAEGLHSVLDYDVVVEDPILLIIGPNEAGKSTLLGVPGICIHGPRGAQWPVLGKSPGYDFHASVSLTDDDGRTQVIGRGMDRGSQYLSINGRPGTLKNVQARVSATVGQATTFDVRAFLGMTPARRLTWMENEILEGSGWTRERIVSELATTEITDIECKPNTEWATTLLDTMRVAGGEAEKSLPPEVVAMVVRTALVSAIEKAGDISREADATAKRLNRALEQGAKDADSAALQHGTIPQWRETLAELQKERGGLLEKKGKIDGAAEVHRTAVKTAELHTKATAQSVEAIATAETELATAERQLATAQLQSKGSGDDHEQLAAEARTAIDKHSATQEEMTTARDALTDAGKLVADLGGQQKAVKPLAEIVADMRFVLETLSLRGASLSPAEVRVREWIDKHNPARIHSAYSAAQATEQDASKALTVAQRAEAVAAADKKLATDALATNEQKRRDYDGQNTRATRAVETATARLERHRVTLKELETGSVAVAEAAAQLPGSADEGLDDALAGVGASIEEAEAAITALNDTQLAKALRMERTSAKTASETKRTNARELIKALRSVLETLLAETTAPLVDAVSRVTLAAMGCRAYVEVVGGFDIGCVRDDDTRIPWATCSESQQLVLVLALAVAVKAKLGGWRWLAVDGLECMDEARRGSFVIAMHEAIQREELDTFIGACVEDGWEPMHGQVVRLEGRSL